jgi:hypothetical protein
VAAGAGQHRRELCRDEDELGIRIVDAGAGYDEVLFESRRRLSELVRALASAGALFGNDDLGFPRDWLGRATSKEQERGDP